MKAVLFKRYAGYIQILKDFLQNPPVDEVVNKNHPSRSTA